MEVTKYNLFSDYNNTQAAYPKGKLHELLEIAKNCYGDKIAIRDKHKEITYSDFYDSVNELAESFPCVNQPMAIVAKKSIQTVIRIFAILQSGNYYIPIDPSYPQERTNYILEKTKARALIDETKISWLHQEEVEIPFKEKLKDGDSVAYVIFTSGSTGLPKGVVETHYQVMNTLYDLKDRLSLSEKDNFLCLASFNFDLSVFDLFETVLVGGTLYIVEDQRDFKTIKSVLDTYPITIWNSVPNVMNHFLKENELSQQVRTNLRACLLSGDYVSTELAKTVLATFPQSQTFSLGGATECSIWSILYLISPETLTRYSYIPYGYPMKNQRIYVLDEQLKVCDLDEIGQIAIAGEGVALGYLGDEKKTGEAFVAHHDLGNIYLTGDLGRFVDKSHIKFVGRMDSRVKVNGYRVSLSEISTAFHSCFGLENRVFSLDQSESTQKIVVAYQSSEALDESKLRKELMNHLAVYELPHVYLNVASFPLTNNVKIDMGELQKIAIEALDQRRRNVINSAKDHSIEMTPFRKMLGQVLNVSQISPNDSLFDLGTDSIQLMKIKNWIEENENIEIELLDIYEHDVVHDLEAFIYRCEPVK
ncbi:non-ribosomal peptide synthetase [Paenibacillus sp. SN-8-1]|uniref:non-ribosomal peptide synthetase n=1 Tax=Paenibacillus sp. SN-8-1 TaxID=3435409 RepID=UPI003D9A6892